MLKLIEVARMTAADQSPGVTSASRRSRLLLVLVAVLWSTSGLFAKAPWLLAWPLETRGILLAFWRTLFAGIFLFPLVKRPRWSWRLLPTGMIFAVMNVTYLTAVSHGTAANAIWLQNTAPLWVLIFTVVCLRQPITRREWPMLAFGMGGIALILTCELTLGGGANQRAVTWGVMGGITFAGVVITLRWVRDLDPAWVITLNHLLTAALLAPVVLHQGIFPGASQTIWLACFGVFQLGMPYVLFARALKHVPSHEASMIVLLEPILVPLWVFLAWRYHVSYEAPAWWTLAGGALILTGLVLRYTARPEKEY